jgi:hypothetical protein
MEEASLLQKEIDELNQLKLSIVDVDAKPTKRRNTNTGLKVSSRLSMPTIAQMSREGTPKLAEISETINLTAEKRPLVRTVNSHLKSVSTNT